jgi:prepilin-type N-terminal cleavage/methylation domain-containing protein/prepilin-type processing-associated H-X9-DG protein
MRVIKTMCKPVPRRQAFTLIELLVVIAIIAILAGILLPVLHQAQLRGETASCIAHQKQLAAAWLMYAGDNNDGCAGNEWSGAPGGEQGWTAYRGKLSPGGTLSFPTNWISGWMDPSGTSPNGTLPNGEADNTNDDLLVDPSYASMGDYVKNRQIFICPSCTVKVYGSLSGRRSYNQVRSISMNCWVGYISNPPGQPAFKEFKKTTQITAGIGPSDLFVFMEERGESIDDGSFETQMGNNTIANWPTDYHNNAATVGFADGHVDVHRWFGEVTSQAGWSCTAPQVSEPQTKWGSVQVSTRWLSDYSWLENHATCLIQ